MSDAQSQIDFDAIETVVDMMSTPTITPEAIPAYSKVGRRPIDPADKRSALTFYVTDAERSEIRSLVERKLVELRKKRK